MDKLKCLAQEYLGKKVLREQCPEIWITTITGVLSQLIFLLYLQKMFSPPPLCALCVHFKDDPPPLPPLPLWSATLLFIC